MLAVSLADGQSPVPVSGQGLSLLYCVRVTLRNPRGASVSNPLACVR